MAFSSPTRLSRNRSDSPVLTMSLRCSNRYVLFGMISGTSVGIREDSSQIVGRQQPSIVGTAAISILAVIVESLPKPLIVVEADSKVRLKLAP